MEERLKASLITGTDDDLLVESIERINKKELYITVADKLKITQNSNYNTLEKVLKEEFGKIEYAGEIIYYNRIKSSLEKIGISVSKNSDQEITIDDKALIEELNTSSAASQVAISKSAPQAIKNLKFLKLLSIKHWMTQNLLLHHQICLCLFFLYFQKFLPLYLQIL